MAVQAVVATGGKQYRVKQGDVLDVELLPAQPGAQVTLDDVRLITADDGRVTADRATLASAKVVAEVEGVVKGPKVVIGRFHAKTHFRRKTGHRQQYTRLRIKEVVTGEAVTGQQAPRQRGETQKAG
ncbi:MAG: 50S ribosomal protein L21 [Dehalococcoidia bacterium]|nr:50S ribosomal protein L21 [Dehalococcoidia bacterium]